MTQQIYEQPHEYQQIFEILHQNITDVFWIYNLHRSTYLYISPSIKELRGFSADETIKLDLSESFHPDDYQYIATNLPPRIFHYEKGDESMRSLTGVFKQKHKNGSYVYVDINTVLVKNKEGVVDLLCGVSRKAADKVADEQILRDTKSLFETVFNFTGTGIALIEKNGKFLNVNKGFCRMVGYPFDYVMQKNLFHFLADGDEPCVHELLEFAQSGKESEVQSEIRLVNLHGRIVWGLINITAIKSANQKETCWAVQIQETTLRKKAEETIRELNHNLQMKNREMEQLVYLTSHDLRSPLVNIRGFTEELRRSFYEVKRIVSAEKDHSVKNSVDLDQIDDEISESFKFIGISVAKMERLLNGLLQYSRVGRRNSKPEMLEMNSLVEDVLKTYEYLIKSQNIKVNVGNLPSCISSEDLIHQLISNLLGNAIKYGANERQKTIQIEGYQNDDRSVYHIRDNGIGIDEKYKEKIFELFYRLHPDAAEGEGLGLSTVKKILEVSGGSIDVSSKPGEGSTFTFTLPAGKIIQEKEIFI